MADKKRKERNEGNRQRPKSKKKRPNTQQKERGPCLPSSLQKQLDCLNPTTSFDSIDSDDYNDNDVHEYKEERAEEVSTKNKRYNPGFVVQDDLSHQFEDENAEDDDYSNENALSDDSGEEDDGRHTRMLQAITSMPSEAFQVASQLVRPGSHHFPSCPNIIPDKQPLTTWKRLSIALPRDRPLWPKTMLHYPKLSP
ncbi:hypothetical protein GmHk_19G055484 [Glycine max]|nr:hypothetical protein GmHk_19G055484 [Glycine max]